MCSCISCVENPYGRMTLLVPIFSILRRKVIFNSTYPVHTCKFLRASNIEDENNTFVQSSKKHFKNVPHCSSIYYYYDDIEDRVTVKR